MTELLEALLDPEFAFLRYAFIAGALASVAFGIMGTYVVARRISYLAGSIAHCVLGGIGAALYANRALGWSWIQPMHGAVVAALLAAITIGLVSLYAKQREDTVIGALWATGMAVGLLFLARTPGYTNAMSYLFGDIMMIGIQDVWLVLGLDVVVVTLATVFYHKFLAVCFDEQFARLRGVNVEAFYVLLLCLTAVTIVLLVQIVGIVMVIALLTLPAAVGSHFSRRLWQMMAMSVLCCLIFVVLGLGCSYSWNLPAGPVIIVFAAISYLTVALLYRFRTG
ncbi:MAG: metal ABC transporter permease [Candidatus Brocadiia bacterium]